MIGTIFGLLRCATKNILLLSVTIFFYFGRIVFAVDDVIVTMSTFKCALCVEMLFHLFSIDLLKSCTMLRYYCCCCFCWVIFVVVAHDDKLLINILSHCIFLEFRRNFTQIERCWSEMKRSE